MKKRKVFIGESDWQRFVMEMRSLNIGWEGESFFQFDVRTAVVLFIGAAVGAILVSLL
jgi:hypothetical protein